MVLFIIFTAVGAEDQSLEEVLQVDHLSRVYCKCASTISSISNYEHNPYYEEYTLSITLSAYTFIIHLISINCQVFKNNYKYSNNIV